MHGAERSPPASAQRFPAATKEKSLLIAQQAF
jgi:hypothetical protein